jgi:hypothetical protein
MRNASPFDRFVAKRCNQGKVRRAHGGAFGREHACSSLL